MNELKKCEICPRKCKVNRYQSVGYCKATNKIKIALASVHMWEEPCISGMKGSGTIFFSYCNLKCVFCQNYKISCGYGSTITIKRLSEICLELQDKNVNNINLVTPTHYVPQIIKAIRKAKENGLRIPIVYNTSGYENLETIKKLNNTVDVYLTDFKYSSDRYSRKYSNAPDYERVAKIALKEMVNQTGKPIIKNGIMQKGVIVRVLLLPGLLEDAKKIIKYLYEEYKDDIYISIMNQYTPIRKTDFENLNRKVTDEEYNQLIDYACDIGVTHAFIQEGETQSESFVPNFDKRGVKNVKKR